jgi:F0F1-type ATP synthase membrane subunit b/b'
MLMTLLYMFQLPEWLNYPGAEVWKFFNLAIFVAGIVYIVYRWILPGFRDRRDGIRDDLLRAQQERDTAVAKLKEVEERLSTLDTELARIEEQSKHEAAEERERIRQATAAELTKLGEQAQREIESAGKAAKHDLRRFAADQSVRMAEDLIRREIRPDDDTRLIQRSIEELGGAAR